MDASTWERPAVFDLIQRMGKIDEREMARTFNCGIGMTAAVKPADWSGVCRALRAKGHAARVIGEVVKGKQDVRIG